MSGWLWLAIGCVAGGAVGAMLGAMVGTLNIRRLYMSECLLGGKCHGHWREQHRQAGLDDDEWIDQRVQERMRKMGLR